MDFEIVKGYISSIILEFPRFYEYNVEESPSISFLEICMECEEHIQKWLLKVENYSCPKATHMVQIHMEH